MANTKNNAHWDPETGKGTYGHSIHHGETIPGYKIAEGQNPSESGQNLAGKKGTDAAKRMLQKYYKKKTN